MSSVYTILKCHDPGIQYERFEFVHNVRKRGKALLGALIELLVT
jgi:hypothetical protein